MVVKRAFLVHSLFDKPTICDDCHRAITNLESIETSMLLSPLCEPESSCIKIEVCYVSGLDGNGKTHLMCVYAFGI